MTCFLLNINLILSVVLNILKNEIIRQLLQVGMFIIDYNFFLFLRNKLSINHFKLCMSKIKYLVIHE